MKAGYGQLLLRAEPGVIHTEGEYRRLLEMTRVLMEKPEEELTEEEGRLLELLGMLVEEYEDRAHPMPKVAPGRMLAYLLAEKGMKAADLEGIMPKSRISEIVHGRRGISKEQARQLAEVFRVPVEVWLYGEEEALARPRPKRMTAVAAKRVVAWKRKQMEGQRKQVARKKQAGA
jgi:HTH-type transcriptional regulator/antitoxin HigA